MSDVSQSDTATVSPKQKKKQSRSIKPQAIKSAVLIRHVAGQNNSRISRDLNIAQNTVKKIIRLADVGNEDEKTVQTLKGILETHGLSDEELVAKYLKPLLSATQRQFFAHEGIVKDERTTKDNRTRKEALDMVLRIKGAYPKEADRGNSIGTVNIVWNGSAPAWAQATDTIDVAPEPSKDTLSDSIAKRE